MVAFDFVLRLVVTFRAGQDVSAFYFGCPVAKVFQEDQPAVAIIAIDSEIPLAGLRVGDRKLGHRRTHGSNS